MNRNTNQNTYSVTHPGRHRSVNEDRHLVKSMGTKMLLMGIADGLGGENGGDHAAQLTMDALGSMPLEVDDKLGALREAIRKADLEIRRLVAADPELEGMGSTVTAVLVIGVLVHWAHVGDSRLYRLRDGRLQQITTDQNMAQFLIEEGQLDIAEARFHPSRNQLDQNVGCGTCEPVVGTFSVRKNDLLILTTDGLHGEIDRHIITRILSQEAAPASKGQALLAAALHSGGRDNITLVIHQL